MKILLLVIALLLPALTFAQSNYKPGYVVTLKVVESEKILKVIK